jgi:prepilin-type N-terminal cleavage/methylation domain-containing protein
MRKAFTLLEMILALTIGVVVLWCFYSVLNYQVQQAQAGRRMLTEGTLARSLFTVMSRDILQTLGPPSPYIESSFTAAQSGTTSSGTTTGTTGTATGTTGTMTGTTGTTGTTAATTAATTTMDTTVVFNNMVYGSSNYLVMACNKVPRELNLTGVINFGNIGDPTQQASVSDLRRISYWLDNGGLAIQEMTVATSSENSITPPTLNDPESKILAPEVKDILFEFWDGMTWQDSWDGTILGGPNENVPVGPPSAIRITITFYRHAPDGTELPDQGNKYEHVVFIPCGNNWPQTTNQ